MRALVEDGKTPAAASLPTNLMCQLLRLAQQARVPTAPWFKGLLLDEADVCDPATRVSPRQASQFIQRAIDALGQPDLGLQVGRLQDIGNFGLVGLAMKTSATLGEALAIGLRYQRMTGALLEVGVEDVGQALVAITAQASQTPPALLPFLCEELFASVLMVARELSGGRFRPAGLQLRYPPPAHAAAYAAVFDCPVRFRQRRDALLFARHWLDLPFPNHNPVTARQVRELCERQLALRSPPRGEVSAHVVRYLDQHLERNPALAEVATALHTSERTLRRHLHAEGTRFGALHDQLRAERATALLREGELGVAQVGARVGFPDVREFRRAFKRWTGLTPSQARET